MARVTEFDVVDEGGTQVPADPHGNNVALSCLECGGPVLALALLGQRGSSEANPSECPKCGQLMWVEVLVSEARMIVRRVHSKRVLLHDEIVDILNEHEGPMSTSEIADEVNRRGRYVKKDKSLVTAYQVHGRTRNYDKIFARQGATVALIQWALAAQRK